LVGVVGDGGALLAAARELRPDVVVADIAMPVLSGLEALRQLRKEGSACKVIFLTMHADAALASAALRAGASGYLLKHSAGDELIRAIGEVLRGRVYLTPLLAQDVPTSPGTRAEMKLTPRQREVLGLIAEGRTMKQIAAALGVTTTAELIRYGLQLGVVAL
jgi:DNA-binding NarL/FixJ family response regulator